MVTTRASAAAVALGALIVLVAGCGTARYQPGAAGTHTAPVPIGTRTPDPVPTGNPTPGACPLMSLGGLRAPGKLMSPAAVPAALAPYRLSSDSQSFTARVTAADLTNAGIDTSGTPQAIPLIVIVNHGRFDRNKLPISQGPNTSINGQTPQPPPYADWVIYVANATTYRLFMWTIGNSPCIRE